MRKGSRKRFLQCSASRVCRKHLTFLPDDAGQNVAMGLRETLKESTRDEHVALEALLALERPALTIHDYQGYLTATHAYYRRIEPRLGSSATLAAMGLDMRRRGKRAWLESDLAWFGLAPIAAADPPVPDVADGARALGCAYVLEGATLGGHVLERLLGPRLGLAPGRGGTFLAGYGARTGAMWRGFLAALEEAGRDGVDERACVEGARETFASLGDWFRDQGWPRK